MDIVPSQHHRIAVAIGYLFHPYVVSVITLALVLQKLAWQAAILWVSILSAILIIPGVTLIQLGHRRQRYVYQRASRTPLYLTFGASIAVCIGLILLANGPHYLLACFVALLIWLPIQLAINHFYTKISVHSAVIAACVVGLLWLGHLPTWPQRGLALLAVIATGWARYITQNHTIEQVLLGWMVGIVAVLSAFALVL